MPLIHEKQGPFLKVGRLLDHEKRRHAVSGVREGVSCLSHENCRPWLSLEPLRGVGCLSHENWRPWLSLEPLRRLAA
jgi:hypothetical protein